MDYEDFTKVQILLKECQSAEEDMRAISKEAHLFVSKQDGQWEPERWSENNGKPRYTFDQTSPIVDQISGDIDESDFDIKVSPANGEATEDGAELLDGMIRNIERISDSKETYAMAGRNMVTGGIDHWMIETAYVDEDSFDQDLIISPIDNSSDRVWLDSGSTKRDRSDSKYGFLLSAIGSMTYKEEFPDGGGSSVSQFDRDSVYYNKPDVVIIGHFYYIKQTPRELVKTKLGRVFEYNAAFKLVEKELADGGEPVVDRRTRMDDTVWMRKFDGQDWLDEAEETVFDSIPIVPCYGNYKVIENKPIYHGVVMKLMDPQRVLNYSLSREIEEGALAPRAKYWMTKTQASGVKKQLATMNTNSDPVQFYTFDPDVPQVPMQQGGAQINQGLSRISDGMQGVMGRTSGIFAAGMGEGIEQQSGVAIGKLQDKSNNITSKYFSSMEVAIARTAKLLGKAIPKVYDTQRQQRIVGADGKIDMTEINQVVFDNETQEEVVINDLSKGKYDYACVSAPSFDSRQSETVSAITELAQYDPSILTTASDILLNNINAPSIDKIAERKRLELFNAGMIPETQMDEEELVKFEEIKNRPPEPDAMMVAAEAEKEKAARQGEKNQITAMKDKMDADNKAAKQQLDMQKANMDLQEKSAKFNMAKQAQQFDQMMKAQELQMKKMSEKFGNMNTQADTLVKLDGIGEEEVEVQIES